MKSTRREKLVNYIDNFLRKSSSSGMGVDEVHLISETCLMFFTGERIVKEILKHMKTVGRVCEDVDGLWITAIKQKLQAQEQEELKSDEVFSGL